MNVEYSARLPDEDDFCQEDWALWQVDFVRRIVSSVAWEPPYLIIGGCIGDHADEWPTVPEDQRPADSVGVFYDDGEKEDAERWASLCALVVEMIRTGIDWPTIRPSEVADRGRRMGLRLNLSFLPQAPTPGVAMSREDIDAMEEQKEDHCRVELARRPAAIPEFNDEGDLFDRVVISYIRLIAGEPPDGVTLRFLWRPSDRWTSVRTRRPAKVVAGWGIDFEDRQKNAALVYAEGWRLAYYAFSGAVDWESVDLGALRNAAKDLGIDLE